MTKIYIIVGIIAVIGIIAALVSRPVNKPTGLENPIKPMGTEPESQSKDENGVTVIVAPKIISTSYWLFDITLDTHSVELDQDIKQTVFLRDEKGGESAPAFWDGDPPGGHHRSVTVKFNPILPQPSTFTVAVKNIGGVPERDFLWKLK